MQLELQYARDCSFQNSETFAETILAQEMQVEAGLHYGSKRSTLTKQAQNQRLGVLALNNQHAP